MTQRQTGGSRRILVVDDHDISGHHAVKALGRGAAEVRREATAARAIATALSWFPHVVCMDLLLPDAGGIETIGAIRAQWPAGRPLPRIIIMTGDRTLLDQDQLKAREINEWLLKPVSGRKLREIAGLSADGAFNAPGVEETHPSLRTLFSAELEQRLPELDDCISRLDWNGTAAILHQLIASAAMSGEAVVESNLRSLDRRCRRRDSPAKIAVRYHVLLESVRRFQFRNAPP